MLFSMIEMIGTVAFAIAGAMTAIHANMDLLGFIVLGEMTAVGGGCLRDILVGRVPAGVFQNPIYAAVALIPVLLLFTMMYLDEKKARWIGLPLYDRILNVSDAVGLGAFTVTGINVAIEQGYGGNAFFSIFLGVLTAVGGGIVRDVLAGQTPAVFRKHIYVVASLAGAAGYYYGRSFLKEHTPIACILVVMVIRILAYECRWDLPRITDQRGKDES